MTARTASGALALALVVAATAGLGYYYPQTLNSAEPAAPRVSGVTEQTLVCPLLRTSPDGSETVSVITAADVAPGTTAGEITGTAAGTSQLPEPGTGRTDAPAEPNGTIEVTAKGGSAGHTATVRNYLDTGDEGRGLAMTTCQQPRSQWWFVGVSALQGHIDELLLSNPAESPAIVTVDVFGEGGPIDVLGVGGVVVQPGERTAVRVDSLIPGVANATLRVTTSGGLVTAAVRSTAIDGLIPQGAEYLPPALAPAEESVVPGVLGGPGARDLVVTAGEQDAAVDVRLLTGSGSRKREGGGLVPVPAGTTVAVDLADDLAGEPAAVAIKATAPVTAAVRSVVPGTLAPNATGVLNRVPSADMAWTAAQPAITDRWLLPLTGVAEAPGGLLLSSSDGSAKARITVLATDGSTEQQEVTVEAGNVRQIDVPIRQGVSAVVEVKVLIGRLNAASFQSGGLPNGPLAVAADGVDPSAKVLLPVAYPDPQVLAGGR